MRGGRNRSCGGSMGRARWGKRGAVWRKSNIVPFGHHDLLLRAARRRMARGCEICAIRKPRKNSDCQIQRTFKTRLEASPLTLPFAALHP